MYAILGLLILELGKAKERGSSEKQSERTYSIEKKHRPQGAKKVFCFDQSERAAST